MGLRVGFIGSGMMAEALAGGFDAAGVAKFTDMTCIDRNKPRRELFASWGVTPREDNDEVAKNCDVIFIAVKPYGVTQVLREMRPSLSKDTLVVSIAAGITIADMEEAAGRGVPIVRVMPNTPCLVGALAAGMAVGSSCDASEHSETLPQALQRGGQVPRSPSPR